MSNSLDKKILFSILVAHYNNYHYFVDCYKSILNQSYQNFEVIIVDDGSSDGSLDKLKELVSKDKRFKIYNNSYNRGVGYTKKKCIDLARGEICAFLDPDDTISKEALELSLNEYRNPEICATYSKLYICDKKLNIEKEFPNTDVIVSENNLFFNINFQITPFFTFKKSIYLETEGLDVTLNSAIDQDLYLKIYERGVLGFVNDKLYYYRIHSNGISRNSIVKPSPKENRHKVIYNTLKRRGIKNIYGKNVEDVSNLPTFIFKKENSIYRKIIRKFNRLIMN